MRRPPPGTSDELPLAAASRRLRGIVDRPSRKRRRPEPPPKPPPGPAPESLTNTDGAKLTAWLEAQRGTGFRFDGQAFTALRGPIVYLWLRGDVPLYVGMSTRGIGRPAGPRHHRLGVQPSDEVLVWPMSDAKQARATELLMIHVLQPVYNAQGRRDFERLSARLAITMQSARRLGRHNMGSLYRRRRGPSPDPPVTEDAPS